MKKWIVAARLRTLPLAFSCIGMGAFLAAFHNSFDPFIFGLCLLTTLFLQVLSNLANDYGDAIHGADSEARKGPSRAVQSGQISKSQMKKAMGLFVVLSLVSGILLLYIAQLPPSVLCVFLVLGVLAVCASILYTNGKIPYGYIGLGDFFVFVFFGIVGVLGTFFLQAKVLPLDLIFPAASCGLLTVAVLNINNIRDIDSDQLAGKFSIPVRLGSKRARVYHIALLIISLVLAVIYVLLNFNNFTQFIFILILPMLIYNAKAILTKPKEELDPLLKQMAISNLLFVLLFGISLLI